MLWRLDADGLLIDRVKKSPFAAGRLIPESEMVAEDAMLFPDGAGNMIRFAADGGTSVEMRTTNLPNFAL